MTDTTFLNTLFPALLVVAMLVVNFKAGPKAKIILALAGTSYMLVHAIMHPETNSKFFAFIGLVFLFQNIRKGKEEKKA